MLCCWLLLVSTLLRYFSLLGVGWVGGWDGMLTFRRSYALPHLSHAMLLAFACVYSATLLLSSWGGLGRGVGWYVNVQTFICASTLVTCYVAGFCLCLLCYVTSLFLGRAGLWGGMVC